MTNKDRAARATQLLRRPDMMELVKSFKTGETLFASIATTSAAYRAAEAADPEADNSTAYKLTRRGWVHVDGVPLRDGAALTPPQLADALEAAGATGIAIL